MRLTVGPLSPTVYWRRRAVVLGAVLLFLVVLLYSCNGQDGGNDATGNGESDPGVATGTPTPTGSVLTPQTGAPPSGDAGADPSTPVDDPDTEPSLSNDPPAVNPASDEGTCADTELSVTATALPGQVAAGAAVDLHLKVRNRSDRTCSRDVGATAQELYIKSGAEVIWSSDTCGTAAGSDVQSFTPGFERAYQVSWNGRDSSRCANGLANGPEVQSGTYEVFARVGTKLSQPAKLVVR
ncbi:hypothetical protein SAMN05443287_114137 [Micromonospora phaseoli]|uniref:Uncharacterized protein n=1 Tax=Micromonospora phaseoli TaxID=1144548 RepID=A0A1H7DJG0_9ACTN|nr:hypothetical protein [Micromonospora phaseoli]PZW02416.1 hypothetical protein CLV64_102793 [Micromonospora phaseoli]GIJ75581.1 hypothetical protein Xph01_00130 [Micromonospora phaseoli]SEK01929.1 hypothetical protein SAMN05443287_114137 [Micromonospora phaseoli]